MDALVKSIMLSPRTVSRSTGRSAVAAAAYRSGERLTNERDGVMHDYRRRAGVVDTYIVAPAGADWAQDRATLWNRAEAAEKRKDAKVAREWVVGLPCELDDEARARLVRAFAGVLVERYGVGVDVALHQPNRAGDERNWHAHLLTTTREITAEGLGGKTRVLDSPKTSGAEVTELRQTWATMSNQALERAGIYGVSYTELSHEDRGLDAPMVHLGPSVTAMERRGIKTNRGNENRRSTARNADLREAREVVVQAEAEVIDLEHERQAEQVRDIERESRIEADQARWQSMPLDDLKREIEALRQAAKSPELREAETAQAAVWAEQRKARNLYQEAKENREKVEMAAQSLWDRWGSGLIGAVNRSRFHLAQRFPDRFGAWMPGEWQKLNQEFQEASSREAQALGRHRSAETAYQAWKGALASARERSRTDPVMAEQREALQEARGVLFEREWAQREVARQAAEQEVAEDLEVGSKDEVQEPQRQVDNERDKGNEIEMD